MKLGLHKLSAERISSRALYIIVGIAAIVFGLFYLIGYDRPFDDDPNFNAPLFTDAVIILMELLILCGIATAAYAVWHTLKVRGHSERIVNGIPVKRLTYSVTIATATIMLLTFLIGSSKPMTINGTLYTETFWLKESDMFVYTSIILIIAAAGAVIYGATKYNRKERRGK